MVKSHAAAALSLFLSLSLVSAGSLETRFVPDRAPEEAARDLFYLDSSFTFESTVSRDGLNLGDQDAFHFSGEYSHRFRLANQIYLRAGVSYNLIDFGDRVGPLPDHLQSLAAVLALEYTVGNEVGAFIQVRPGFYTEDTFDEDSFDMPITVARAWVLQPDKLYILTGVNVAFLRGQFPVLPVAGVIWYPNDQWKVFASVPEPRVTYSPNDHIGIWAGVQFAGGSFRTEPSTTVVPRVLSNATVDYLEVRTGVGVDFRFGRWSSLGIGAGYVAFREFDFHRAGVDFDADPSPFVRAVLKAEF